MEEQGGERKGIDFSHEKDMEERDEGGGKREGRGGRRSEWMKKLNEEEKENEKNEKEKKYK